MQKILGMLFASLFIAVAGASLPTAGTSIAEAATFDKPTVVEAAGLESTKIYANGLEIKITAGTAANSTHVQYRDNTGGWHDVDLTPTSSPTSIDSEGDLTTATIYGGALNETVNSTNIIMQSGYINTIYGGGHNGDVTGDTSVNVATSATEGFYYVNNIYGGGRADVDAESASVGGNTNITITGSLVPDEWGGQYINLYIETVFGGGHATQNCEAAVNATTKVTVNTCETGTIFGGGYGFSYYGETLSVEAKAPVLGSTSVILKESEVYGDVHGGGKSEANTGGYSDKPRADVGQAGQDSTSIVVENTTVRGSVFGGGHGEAADNTVYGNTQVNIKGTSNVGVVFGGSHLGNSGLSLVDGNTNVTILDTVEIGRNVYGGGGVYNVPSRSSDTSTSYTPEDFFVSYGTGVSGNTTITITGTSETERVSVNRRIYGGAESGYVTGNTSITTKNVKTIDLIGGSSYKANGGEGELGGYVGGDTAITATSTTVENIYGGGLSYYVGGNTNVTIGTGTQVSDNVYGGGRLSPVGKDTFVTVDGGTVGGMLFGGGLSGDVGYALDNTALQSGKIAYIENAGFGNATISILSGTVGQVYGSGFIYDEGAAPKTTLPDTTSESGSSFDDFFPKNLGDVYIFVDDDATLLGNVYKTIIGEFSKTETQTLIQMMIAEGLVEEEALARASIYANWFKFVEGSATVVLEQGIAYSPTATTGGIGNAFYSGFQFLILLITGEGDFTPYEVGTGFGYNGEGLNILRIEQRPDTSVYASEQPQTPENLLVEAGEQGAWQDPHWTIQGNVVLSKVAADNIEIVVGQELYIPNDATLKITADNTTLINNGYIVTAHGDLGKGIETGFVNAQTSNATSRIYRGDANSLIALTPASSTYAVGAIANPIISAISPNYSFLLETLPSGASKLAHGEITWTQDGQSISVTGSQVTPLTDKEGQTTYSAATAYTHNFESVPSNAPTAVSGKTSLVENGTALANAIVQVGDFAPTPTPSPDPTNPDGNNSSSRIPNTGDTGIIWLFLTLAVLSLGGISYAAFNTKMKR